MDIEFRTKSLRKHCTTEKARIKKWGPDRGRKIGQRLDELSAATALEDLRNAPGRCHELTGDRAGQLAVSIDKKLRLIFKPADDPPPLRNDGGLDWSRVSYIQVLEGKDYHNG